jgi:hypothetical protein
MNKVKIRLAPLAIALLLLGARIHCIIAGSCAESASAFIERIDRLRMLPWHG